MLNVVVRLLSADEPDQFRRSKNLFDREWIFIPLTVIQETEWVLRFAYKFKREQIVDGLRRLLGLPNVILQSPSAVKLAIDWHESGLDFSDALHLAQSHNCQRLMTFDKKFVKAGQELAAIPVDFPPG